MAESKTPDANVDTLLEAFSTDVGVTPEDDRYEHPRYSQYKNYGRLAESQRTRRDEWMTRQRERRDQRLNESRDVDEKDETTEEMTTEAVEESKDTNQETLADVEMDEVLGRWNPNRRRNENNSWSSSNNSNIRRAFNKKSRFIRKDLIGRLMYSEWLLDKPTNFEDEWLMVPAPKGKRGLLIFDNFGAEIFNKLGERIERFRCPSVAKLPVILDAITHRFNKTVYIIDLVESQHCDGSASDFECRRFMLQSYLESADLLTLKGSEYKFELMPTIRCSKLEMEKFMAQVPDYTLDGLMFYHKEAFYTAGETPMVEWLKPWMMPDLIDVDVCLSYLSKARSSQKEYIDMFAREHPSYAKPIRYVGQKTEEMQGEEEKAGEMQ